MGDSHECSALFLFCGIELFALTWDTQVWEIAGVMGTEGPCNWDKQKLLFN